MATIHDYRQRAEYKLDCLEMEAAALEDDLTHTHEQVIKKYESLKMSLRDALITVKHKLKDFKQLTSDQRQRLITKIDELQINLALGRADTERKLLDQKQKIMNRLKALEKEIDLCLKHQSTELTEHMLHASDRLNAEFAALEIFFCTQSERARTNFSNNRNKLLSQLHEFNQKLEEKCQAGAQKSQQFEKELALGLKTIKNAFLHLKD